MLKNKQTIESPYNKTPEKIILKKVVSGGLTVQWERWGKGFWKAMSSAQFCFTGILKSSTDTSDTVTRCKNNPHIYSQKLPLWVGVHEDTDVHLNHSLLLSLSLPLCCWCCPFPLRLYVRPDITTLVDWAWNTNLLCLYVMARYFTLLGWLLKMITFKGWWRLCVPNDFIWLESFCFSLSNIPLFQVSLGFLAISRRSMLWHI